MNQSQFNDRLKSLMTSSPLETNFIINWYKNILKQLESLKKQSSSIEHPRYRGNEREGDFTKVLKNVLPSSVLLSRGFAINEYATKSSEQDCLLLDSNRTATFIRTENTTYFPIDTILGSVEIKSKMNLSELRKIILNCVSLKKLAYPHGMSDNFYKEEPSVKIAFFIFAYESIWSSIEAAKKINQLLESVPVTLRPNMFFILNQGFIMPRGKNGFANGPDQMFTDDKFVAQGEMGTTGIPKSLAPPFLWFLSNIVDHSLHEIEHRKADWYCKFLIAPMLLQQSAGKSIKDKS